MNTISRLLYNLFFFSAAALSAAEIPSSPSAFVMDALCAQDGSLWIATEGKGLWMLPPGGSTWRDMTACKSALPTQNYYALVQDAAGRIWAGTDNCGLGVWNGKEWNAYSRMEGMPGERVFAIAVYANDVAVATNGGVVLYREGSAEPWQFFNRAEGMADDACASLCFGEKGTLWAAYSCGGAGYLPAGAAKWKNFSAPWDFGGGARQPYEPEGRGLPGNLGNAILATPGGSVFYACTCGLASVKRGSKDWSFLRGADSRAKNEGIFKPQIPAGLEEAAKKPGPLLEDYVTALCIDGDFLWLGFREKGVQKLRLRDMAPVEDKDVESFNADKNARHLWVRKFVRLTNGFLYAATNGGGLRLVTAQPSASKEKGNKKKNENPAAVAADFPVLPPVLSEPQLAKLTARLTDKKAPRKDAFFWYDDWLTRGNWCHSYGTHAATLCAANAPANVHVLFHRNHDCLLPIAGAMGPHRKKGDNLRHWLHEINAGSNQNVLWNSSSGIRTEAEWDDHGEDYARSWDGPDVWASFTVDEGEWLVSLYFYNPNGHENRNGYRDYLLELRHGEPIPSSGKHPKIGEKVLSLPTLARTRVSDFAGCGCWKNFIVSRPGTYYVRVCRNNSFNTILNGCFLSDRSYLLESVHYCPLDHAIPNYRRKWEDVGKVTVSHVPQVVLRAWAAAFLPTQGHYALARHVQLAAYRHATAADASPVLLERWRFLLGLWTPHREAEMNANLLESWYHVQNSYPYARSAQYRPHSPRVVPLSPEELEYADAHGIWWQQFLPEFKGERTMTIEQLRKQAKRTSNNQ